MRIFRVLKQTDKESFKHLMNHYIEEYVKMETVYPVHFDSHIGEIYWNHIQKDPKKYIGVIAEEEGVFIGFCIGEIRVYDDVETVYFEGDKRAEVWELYVDPQHRNRRIGEQLLLFMERECIARGCHHIILIGVDIKNEQAQRLYQRLNYTPWNMKYYKKVNKDA